MVARIDVRDSRELQATLLALKRADRDLRKTLYGNARKELSNAWLPALKRRTRTNLESQIMLKGTATKVGLDGFRMRAATSKRKFSNGLIPAFDWPGAEFGARNRRGKYTRRGAPVERMLNRQFRNRQKDGQIAFDAASEIGTKLVASFVKSIVHTFRAVVGDGR